MTDMQIRRGDPHPRQRDLSPRGKRAPVPTSLIASRNPPSAGWPQRRPGLPHGDPGDDMLSDDMLVDRTREGET